MFKVWYYEKLLGLDGVGVFFVGVVLVDVVFVCGVIERC